MRKFAICHMRSSPRPPSVFELYVMMTFGNERSILNGVLGGPDIGRTLLRLGAPKKKSDV